MAISLKVPTNRRGLKHFLNVKSERAGGCQAKTGLHPALWHVEVYSAAETASYHLVASRLHSKLGFLWQWCSWKWYCDSQTNCFCIQVPSKEVAWKETKKKAEALSHKLLLKTVLPNTSNISTLLMHSTGHDIWTLPQTGEPMKLEMRAVYN